MNVKLTMYFISQLPIIVPGSPLKISFDIVAVTDPNDGLQPSDLTPDTAYVRVMVLKANQVNVLKFISKYIVFLYKNIFSPNPYSPLL